MFHGHLEATLTLDETSLVDQVACGTVVNTLQKLKAKTSRAGKLHVQVCTKSLAGDRLIVMRIQHLTNVASML